MSFIELSGDAITELSEVLKSRFPHNAAQLYNRTQIYLKQILTDNLIGVNSRFYCYGGLPQTDTCIASRLELTQQEQNSYWIITCPKLDTKQIETMLTALENIVNWENHNCFNGVEEWVYPALRTICLKYNSSLRNVTPDFVYWMSISDGLNIAVDLRNSRGDEISLRKLELHDICKVMQHWKYASDSVYDDIVASVSHLSSAGLILNGELVSWGILMQDGAIHALHTLESHRGKGYGKMLMKYLTNLVANNGMVPVVQIEADNATSLGLLKSLGFRFSHKMCWTEVSTSSRIS